jgi:hypothetical protein
MRAFFSRLMVGMLATTMVTQATQAAWASPAPEPTDHPFAPPQVLPADGVTTSFATELRWMLAGAAVALLLAALALVLAVGWQHHRYNTRHARISKAPL